MTRPIVDPFERFGSYFESRRSLHLSIATVTIIAASAKGHQPAPRCPISSCIGHQPSHAIDLAKQRFHKVHKFKFKMWSSWGPARVGRESNGKLVQDLAVVLSGNAGGAREIPREN